MAKLNILVAEDDALSRELMAEHLHEHKVDFAITSAAALEKLETGMFDLCFIDLKLGAHDALSGLKLLATTKSRKIYSVVMSAHDSEAIVDKAYALGCDDFYAKGNEKNDITSLLKRFLSKRDESKKDNFFAERFITEDPKTRASIAEALTYASASLPVLILGPSGTGKTNLARIIHDHSGRTGEFIAINCSAYNEELLEAELFGYKKGAYTGAAEKHRGKLLLAHRGTLFLDEIGSMSLKMQTKLLKAIEEHSFYPMGSDKPETSDFRIISATLEDLDGLMREGKLRADFFHRVHGLTINLKPLAQRRGDIFPLISFFARSGNRRLTFDPAAKEALLQHHWPGNIRELKKLVELLVSGHEGPVTRDAVASLLSKLSVEVGGKQFLTEEQYRFALNNGLDALLDRIAESTIKRNLTENEGKKVRVYRDLNICNAILYKALRSEDKAVSVPSR